MPPKKLPPRKRNDTKSILENASKNSALVANKKERQKLLDKQAKVNAEMEENMKATTKSVAILVFRLAAGALAVGMFRSNLINEFGVNDAMIKKLRDTEKGPESQRKEIANFQHSAEDILLAMDAIEHLEEEDLIDKTNEELVNNVRALCLPTLKKLQEYISILEKRLKDHGEVAPQISRYDLESAIKDTAMEEASLHVANNVNRPSNWTTNGSYTNFLIDAWNTNRA